MIRLTVEGRAFYVRPEQIVAIGSDPDGGTLVTVAFIGALPVDESVEAVLSAAGATPASTGPR